MSARVHAAEKERLKALAKAAETTVSDLLWNYSIREALDRAKEAA